MRKLRKHIRPGRLLVTLAVALGFLGTFGLGQANAWSLKEAATPYAGTTIPTMPLGSLGTSRGMGRSRSLQARNAACWSRRGL